MTNLQTEALEDALLQLYVMGALDEDGTLTPAGRKMVRLKLTVRPLTLCDARVNLGFQVVFMPMNGKPLTIPADAHQSSGTPAKAHLGRVAGVTDARSGSGRLPNAYHFGRCLQKFSNEICRRRCRWIRRWQRRRWRRRASAACRTFSLSPPCCPQTASSPAAGAVIVLPAGLGFKP